MTKTYREQRRLYSGEYYIILCSAHKKQVQLYYDTNNIGTRKIALLFLLVILIDLTRHLQLSNVKKKKIPSPSSCVTPDGSSIYDTEICIA